MRGSVFQAYIDQLQQNRPEKNAHLSFTHTETQPTETKNEKKKCRKSEKKRVLKKQHRNKYELYSILWII